MSQSFIAPYLDYINTSEATYTIPAGVTKLKIICQGGGGYGGSIPYAGSIYIAEITVSTINTYRVKTKYNVTFSKTPKNGVFKYGDLSIISYGGHSGTNPIIYSRVEPGETAGTSSIDSIISINMGTVTINEKYSRGSTTPSVQISPDYPYIPNVGNAGSSTGVEGQPAGVRVYFIY